MSEKSQILLTNDDGIDSPGLWAAAEALSELGYVHVIAPLRQSSGVGRSMPNTSDGKIESRVMRVHQKAWTVYSVGGTPAQAVAHGILEIMLVKPDLVVSGINYGENVGSSVTASGTVGAALQASAMGVPGLAVSIQTPTSMHFTHSKDVDFATAAGFTVLIARRMLEHSLPVDVDVIKVEVPDTATPDTPWRITRQSKHPYYVPTRPRRNTWDETGPIGYQILVDPHQLPQDTDIYALLVDRVVSVTPLSLDLTSRVAAEDLDYLLRFGQPRPEPVIPPQPIG